jgi:hypothetical protein
MTAETLLSALEFAGLTLTVAANGKMLVSPGKLLEAEDRADLARLKPELIALLRRREADWICGSLGDAPPPVPKLKGWTA